MLTRMWYVLRVSLWLVGDPDQNSTNILQMPRFPTTPGQLWQLLEYPSAGPDLVTPAGSLSRPRGAVCIFDGGLMLCLGYWQGFSWPQWLAKTTWCHYFFSFSRFLHQWDTSCDDCAVFYTFFLSLFSPPKQTQQVKYFAAQSFYCSM